MNTQSASSLAAQADELARRFSEYLLAEGLKATRQRDLIVRIFGASQGHISVEELVRRVNEQQSGVGYATVYRTLKLLVHAGLASMRQFGDGRGRFEIRSSDHHDHLICAECGYVAEFYNEEIEELQTIVAAEHQFTVQRHRHELYGQCEYLLDGKNCPRALQASSEHVVPARTISTSPQRPVSSEPVDLMTEFAGYLRREGLKSTRQRDLIVETFANHGGHMSVEQLLAEVNRVDSGVGHATVYRSLKLLVEAGLAAERHFDDGQASYESRGEEHHDHMICTNTGRIIEFRNDEIEELQEVIARDHGFRLLRHRHELYGTCDDAGDDS